MNFNLITRVYEKHGIFPLHGLNVEDAVRVCRVCVSEIIQLHAIIVQIIWNRMKISFDLDSSLSPLFAYKSKLDTLLPT